MLWSSLFIVFFFNFSQGILLKLTLCKFYYFNHPQVVWPIYYVWTIVLGNQINCFTLHIIFKVHGSSIMEFPDWVKVKVKIVWMKTQLFLIMLLLVSDCY